MYNLVFSGDSYCTTCQTNRSTWYISRCAYWKIVSLEIDTRFLASGCRFSVAPPLLLVAMISINKKKISRRPSDWQNWIVLIWKLKVSNFLYKQHISILNLVVVILNGNYKRIVLDFVWDHPNRKKQTSSVKSFRQWSYLSPFTIEKIFVTDFGGVRIDRPW